MAHATARSHRNPRRSFAEDARRLAPLAWPVFVGQLAVLGFATIDTVLIARYSALDLAALAVGNAAYVSVFVGLMGVVLAVGPIAGRLFGGGQLIESGRQFAQAVWLGLALSVPGCLLLAFPQPFLAVARAAPEVAAMVRAYLDALAFALPPALLFTAFRGFNTSVSRPKAVMALQLGGLALKAPLSALLVYGAGIPTPLGALHSTGRSACTVRGSAGRRRRRNARCSGSACRWGCRSRSRSPASHSWPSSSRAWAPRPWPGTKWR